MQANTAFVLENPFRMGSGGYSAVLWCRRGPADVAGEVDGVLHVRETISYGGGKPSMWTVMFNPLADHEEAWLRLHDALEEYARVSVLLRDVFGDEEAVVN